MRGGPSYRKGLHARRVDSVGDRLVDGVVSDIAGQVSEARQCRRINGVKRSSKGMFGLASAVSRAHKWSSTPSGTQIVGLGGAGVAARRCG
jgi:hypothetical protein